MTYNQKMSLTVFESQLQNKIPKRLKELSVLGPFNETYKGKECVYFGGYRNNKKFGYGKMMLHDKSYLEGVFDNDSIGMNNQLSIFF